MKTALVTGSCGLVGSAVTRRLLRDGWKVCGLDNNSRFAYFGIDGDTRGTLATLVGEKGYEHLEVDLRERTWLNRVLPEYRFDLVVHAAAQPSHDLAARIPLEDFEVNAYGTLNLLELARQYWKEAPFVFLSTNKVYGDGPNRLNYAESSLRYDFFDRDWVSPKGIDEDFPVDQSTHSLFGCSKLAADLYVQEYGRYFGLPTCCLRCGCLTGEGHAAAELHGFLAYVARATREGRKYVVYGFNGKQVRDSLHAEDVASFILAFEDAPRTGEIYNLGGGFSNSCSVLEAIKLMEVASGKTLNWEYVDEVRRGDHRVYYSDLTKVKRDYPGWGVTVPLGEIVRRLCRS